MRNQTFRAITDRRLLIAASVAVVVLLLELFIGLTGGGSDDLVAGDGTTPAERTVSAAPRSDLTDGSSSAPGSVASVLKGDALLERGEQTASRPVRDSPLAKDDPVTTTTTTTTQPTGPTPEETLFSLWSASSGAPTPGNHTFTPRPVAPTNPSNSSTTSNNGFGTNGADTDGGQSTGSQGDTTTAQTNNGSSSDSNGEPTNDDGTNGDGSTTDDQNGSDAEPTTPGGPTPTNPTSEDNTQQPESPDQRQWGVSTDLTAASSHADQLVTGSGWIGPHLVAGDRFVVAAVCRAGSRGLQACDLDGTMPLADLLMAETDIDRAHQLPATGGNFVVQIRIPRTIDVPRALDCAIEFTCELVIADVDVRTQSDEAELRVIRETTVAFTTSSERPILTLDAVGELTDYQSVTVRLTDHHAAFNSDPTIRLRQCAVSLDDDQPTCLELSDHSPLTVSDDGSGSTTLSVNRWIDGRDCAVARCWIDSGPDASGQVGLAELSFQQLPITEPDPRLTIEQRQMERPNDRSIVTLTAEDTVPGSVYRVEVCGTDPGPPTIGVDQTRCSKLDGWSIDLKETGDSTTVDRSRGTLSWVDIVATSTSVELEFVVPGTLANEDPDGWKAPRIDCSDAAASCEVRWSRENAEDGDHLRIDLDPVP